MQNSNNANILSLHTNNNLEEGEISDTNNDINSPQITNNIDDISKSNNESDYELPTDFLNYYMSPNQPANVAPYIHTNNQYTPPLTKYDRFGRIKRDNSDDNSSGYWSEPPPKDLRFHSDSSISSTPTFTETAQSKELHALQKLFPWDNNRNVNNSKSNSKKHRNRYKAQGQYDGRRKLKVNLKRPYKDWDNPLVEGQYEDTQLQYFEDKAVAPMTEHDTKAFNPIFESLLNTHMDHYNESKQEKDIELEHDSTDSFVELLQHNTDTEEDILYPVNVRRKAIVLDKAIFTKCSDENVPKPQGNAPDDNGSFVHRNNRRTQRKRRRKKWRNRSAREGVIYFCLFFYF